MQVLKAIFIVLVAVFAVPTIVAAYKENVRRDDLTAAADICGEVDADLTVPNLELPGTSINFGHINQCLCLSDIPNFMTTHSYAVSAVALVGTDQTNEALTGLVYGCPGQTCSYPPHAVPECQVGNPCGFTCKDGYTPYPAWQPTQCVCNPPYIECNGNCGVFNGCPSSYLTKRDLPRGKRCPVGYTACGIPTRGASSWECLDTQTELESCGGCVLSLYGTVDSAREGVDCTTIPGVSDVSCVRGSCQVHRCMPGYEVATSGSSCLYVEDHDPIILAAQYGLEHLPF